MMSYPVSIAHASTLCVPGDKSIAHRVVMLASLASGTHVIHGVPDGLDVWATIRAFQAMGVLITTISDSCICIQGVGQYGLSPPKSPIDCGNSGTTMRLLAGLLVGQSFDAVLTGDASLSQRPMGRVVKPLQQMGAMIQSMPDGCAPLTITGGARLRNMQDTLLLPSAQVKSAILLAGLYAEGTTTLIESEPTRDHTERLMKAFGYAITTEGTTITLTPGKPSCLSSEVQIPGDISAAAFFVVAATLIPKMQLCIKNVGVNPKRMGFVEILRMMGASIEIVNFRQWGGERVADLQVQYAPLIGVKIPTTLVTSAIDEFPILFIAAARAKGRTTLSGAGELRVKESDRIRVMAEGLTKLGIEVEQTTDGMQIEGGCFLGGEVDSAHDHRVAMAFAIAGALAEAPIYIQHSEAIATSFPAFIASANQIGLKVRSKACQ